MKRQFAVEDDGWRIPDELWAKIEPLLPPPAKQHPWGVHRPRVDNRRAMDAIFFVLRSGCQWNALNATGICSSSSAHRRFQEWTEAGVFREIWKQALEYYDAHKRLDWRWRPGHGGSELRDRADRLVAVSALGRRPGPVTRDTRADAGRAER